VTVDGAGGTTVLAAPCVLADGTFLSPGWVSMGSGRITGVSAGEPPTGDRPAACSSRSGAGRGARARRRISSTHWTDVEEPAPELLITFALDPKVHQAVLNAAAQRDDKPRLKPGDQLDQVLANYPVGIAAADPVAANMNQALSFFPPDSRGAPPVRRGTSTATTCSRFARSEGPMPEWFVTETSMVVEADTEIEAVDRAQETSGWHWDADAVLPAGRCVLPAAGLHPRPRLGPEVGGPRG